MTEKFSPAGSVTVDDILVFNEDSGQVASLKPAMIDLTITESINNKAITAVLRVADMTDIFRRFPLYGHEPVVITWISPTFKAKDAEVRKTVFRIKSITSVSTTVENKGINFVLDLISEFGYMQEFVEVDEAYKDTATAIAKTVHKKVIDQLMVGDIQIIEPDLNQLNAHETDSIIEFIAPVETPFVIFDFLTSWASSTEFISNLYLFFQNKNGFNFVNVEQLVDELYKKKDDEEIVDTKTFFFTNSLNSGDERGAYAIKHLQQAVRNDLFTLVRTGRLSNTVTELDYVNKRVTDAGFTYNYDQERNKFVGKVLLAGDKFKESFGTVATENHWVYRDALREDKNFKYALGYKWGYNKLFYNNTIQLNIPGNSELTCGELIKLEIPSLNAVNPNDELRQDKSLAGHYLVKDVFHIFTQRSYDCDVVCCRIGAIEIDDTEV